jgi:hypothetical protein
VPSMRRIAGSPSGVVILTETWPFAMRCSVSPGSPSWKITSPLAKRLRVHAGEQGAAFVRSKLVEDLRGHRPVPTSVHFGALPAVVSAGGEKARGAHSSRA